MLKNVYKTEQIVRVVLGILFGLLAIFVNSWPGWARIVSGIVAVAFLGTAFSGY